MIAAHRFAPTRRYNICAVCAGPWTAELHTNRPMFLIHKGTWIGHGPLLIELRNGSVITIPGWGR